MQEIELKIKDDNEDGVFAVSLVESPAIEENFIALSSNEIELKIIDEDRRIVVGYALIPDKKIYRKMKPKGAKEPIEFMVYFSKETIEKTQELYMKNLYLNNVTSEHEKPLQGATVIESWITEDLEKDKINLYKVEPKLGGWAIMMKIYNDEEWSKVKGGDYKGFSIEGIYQGFEALEMSEDKNILEQIKSIIDERK